jgi:hypothetical protein
MIRDENKGSQSMFLCCTRVHVDEDFASMGKEGAISSYFVGRNLTLEYF